MNPVPRKDRIRFESRRSAIPPLKVVGQRFAPHQDFYHWILRRSWPEFIGLVAAVYISINALFAVLYTLSPDALANAQRRAVVFAGPAGSRIAGPELGQDRDRQRKKLRVPAKRAQDAAHKTRRAACAHILLTGALLPRSRLRRSTRVVPSKYAERLSIYAAFEKAVHFKRTTQPAHGMRNGHCRHANANDLQIQPRPPGRNHIGTGARNLRSVNTRGSRAATSCSSQRTSSASAKKRQSGMPPAMPPEWQQLSFRFGTTGPTRVLSMRCLVGRGQGAFVPARSGLPSHVATSPALRARRRSPRSGAR